MKVKQTNKAKYNVSRNGIIEFKKYAEMTLCSGKIVVPSNNCFQSIFEK